MVFRSRLMGGGRRCGAGDLLWPERSRGVTPGVPVWVSLRLPAGFERVRKGAPNWLTGAKRGVRWGFEYFWKDEGGARYGAAAKVRFEPNLSV